MKTLKVSANYELSQAMPGSPALGLSILCRLSDHEVSDWFDNETAEELKSLSDEEFDQECANYF